MTLPTWSAPADGDRSGRELPLTDRRLGPEDLARVLALHEAAHRAAQTPGLFVRETPGFFAAHLGLQGEILGLEAPDGTLACYCVLGLPAAGAAGNFGLALGLTSAERARVCHLDGTAVLPAWRGRGLQRRMTRRRLALARAAGRDIALSTTALGNHWSLANLTAEGLRVVALVEEYGTHRLMLRADARAPEPIPCPEAHPQVRAVPLDGCAARHGPLLAGGWQGVGVSRASGVPSLLYLPPVVGRPHRGPGP